MKEKVQWPKMFISILLPFTVGMLGNLLSGDSMHVYAAIAKPDFAPPGWVFPVVWSILYLCMGIAAYRGWTHGASMKFYYLQLFFNFLWPIIFFRYQYFLLAFFDLLLVAVFIIGTMLRFAEKDVWSAVLLIPYLLWVVYAGVLNYAIFLLNCF